MKCKFNVTLLICYVSLIIGLTSFSIQAGTIYVSPTGSDSAPNDGTINKPYLTINKAASIAVAGDVVIIKSGTYMVSSSIIVSNSGTSSQPITFKAEVKDGVIINGSSSSTPNISDRQGLFTILGTSGTYKNWIIVDGLRIINSNFAGIYARYSDNIIVKNCSTYNTGASGIIAANSSNIKVLNNKVQQACMYPSPAVGTNECITMASVNTFEVAYNTVSDRPTDTSNGGEGIDAKNACINGKIHHNTLTNLFRTAIYIDAYGIDLSNIEVYNNKVYNTSSGITVASEEGGTVTNVKIYNNLLFDIQAVGIRIAGWLRNGPIRDISVYQNTAVRCGLGKIASNWENCSLLLEADNNLNSNFIVRNNIFAHSTNQMRWKNQNYAIIENNLVFGFSTVTGGNAIISDPKFMNLAAKDFRLESGSPAIDAALGSPVSTIDYHDVARPLGSATEIGAFEYYPTSIWTGTTSTDFTDSRNWSNNVIPSNSLPFTIYTGTPFTPIITTDTSISGAFIAEGATLTVAEGKFLTNTGSIINNGDLILKSGTNGTASLISNSSVANVTQQRYLTSNQRGWRLLSNPLSNTTFSTLATASSITLGPNFTGEYLTGSNGGSWTSTDGIVPMEYNKAYKVFITGRSGESPAYINGISNVTIVNKGTAFNITPGQVITSAGQYYLLANPYTAPISLSYILGSSSVGLSNSVAYYDPRLQTTNTKVKGGGYTTLTPSGNKGSTTDVLIPAMGAIFVYANSPGYFDIPKESIFTGTPNGNSGIYTQKIVQSIGSTSLSGSIKIEVTSNSVKYDNLYLQFNEAGANSNIAISKLPNTFLDLYSIGKDQRKMAVAELELADQTIPLGITSTQLKNFSFTVIENSIPDGFEAVLVDKLTYTTIALSTGTKYDFSIDNTTASQGNERFEINLKTKTSITAIENKLDPNLKIWPVPATDEFNITNNQAPNEGNSQISIINLSGQLIYSHQSSPGSTTTIRTNGWTPGIYILNATKNGKQNSSKLIIK